MKRKSFFFLSLQIFIMRGDELIKIYCWKSYYRTVKTNIWDQSNFRTVCVCDFSVMFIAENEIIHSYWRQIYRLLHYFFERPRPNFVGLLEDLKLPKGHFEINWPLAFCVLTITIFEAYCQMLLLINAAFSQCSWPNQQCVKRSCFYRVPLHSRSLSKKRSGTPTSLLLKKKEWHSLIALLTLLFS